jgi:hypothetical protein
MGVIASNFSNGSGQWGSNNGSASSWATFSANNVHATSTTGGQYSLFFTVGSFGATQTSTVTLGSANWTSTGAGPGVTVRSIASGTRYRFVWFSSTWYLQYGLASGTGNLTGTINSTAAPASLNLGDKLTLSAVGSALTCLYNGSQVLSGTNSNISSGGSPGIEFQTGTVSTQIYSLWTGSSATTPKARCDAFFGF